MDVALIQTILTVVSFALIAVGVGGGGFLIMRSAVGGARRRARLSGEVLALGQATGEAGRGGKAFAGVLSGVRRLGDRVAIQDPAQVTALRQRLIQAGFFNREAVTLYLGARAIAM